jgi:hypothetical protein
MAISFIYVCVCVAWMILGGVVMGRSNDSGRALGENVEVLWGGSQTQVAPEVYLKEPPQPPAGDKKDHKDYSERRLPLTLSKSNVDVNLNLQQRKKGLLWYPTYKVRFHGLYNVVNPTDQRLTLVCSLKLPSQTAVYDNLKVALDGTAANDVTPTGGFIHLEQAIAPHAVKSIEIGYDSQGLDEWRYAAGDGAAHIKDFKLAMTTDFSAIDFPGGTRSPTSRERTKDGWRIRWDYNNTVTGAQIGLLMPHKLNPGPWVGQVTFFAPVSLFFFFFVTWLITTVKSINMHPMHYFFIGAAFFSFHLLMAYSVDQIPVEVSFAVASAVSIFLVLTYIRRAVPDRRLFALVGMAQFVYLIFFSFTFFVEQFTGLIITCLSIFTLFLSMQYTARFDWSRVFNKQLAAADQAAVSESMVLIDPEFQT